ncbi:MBL fold metallo-hydrolase [Accumulibacter sp.]|uniref:ribonuclease Z n=1 Tax=Accumulibacter sp. TaxID=2053492 RepID=UPI0025FDCD1D|nr:MBL fold metallo-hydrolase [Accumulibacter sp.]MCM8596490.1 MBL fold metallo-hydrolase [Accumulibacter sp.]MCM8627338.1 MBL fold metallo-hydrolase [Accumulibacter sp.]MDS4050638.1 MBL fold metallo-hydrolase [Accumulibacter sp.]
MRPSFRVELVNPPSGDPALLVDFLFEKRALLFDLGDLRALAPRKILRTSHVFVSHMHLDHFMGFDWLLRVSLGRPNAVELYGPPGILAQVEAKLAAYTWNLVHNYAGNFTLEVGELWPDGRLERAKFACRERFRREAGEASEETGGVLIDTGGFRVRAVFLDHEVPVLGFLLEEHAHVNLWKNRLGEMGLVVGPWLQKLKRAVISGLDDDTPIRATGAGGGEPTLTLGELKPALRVVPGTRIAYVTDVVDHEENARRIARLADHADVLYIEAVFLDADAAHAARKFHLTARQAGRIARAAGVRSVVPFHFSPRYAGREAELREELQRAFAGD